MTLRDELRPRFLSDFAQYALIELEEGNLYKSSRELARPLNISKSNLPPLGKDKKSRQAKRLSSSYSLGREKRKLHIHSDVFKADK